MTKKKNRTDLKIIEVMAAGKIRKVRLKRIKKLNKMIMIKISFFNSNSPNKRGILHHPQLDLKTCNLQANKKNT